MAILKRPGLKTPASTPARKLGGLAKKPGKPGGDGGFGSGPKHKTKSGGAFAAAAAERKKQELERLKPWNLSVGVGKSIEVYILDHGEPWTRYEHTVGGGPNSRGKIYPCIKDGNEQCPLCQRESKEGAFVMYLTCVVPIDSYEKADGEVVTRRFQKKLFPIKTKMSGKYQRLFETHGNLRGAVLRVSRDNKMDPATGNDVDYLRRLSEADIKKFAAAAGFKGDTKDQIIKAKIDEPYDYEKVMPRPSGKELAAMVGVRTGGSVGSSDFEDDGYEGDSGDWGAGDDAGDTGTGGWGG